MNEIRVINTENGNSEASSNTDRDSFHLLHTIAHGKYMNPSLLFSAMSKIVG